MVTTHTRRRHQRPEFSCRVRRARELIGLPGRVLILFVCIAAPNCDASSESPVPAARRADSEGAGGDVERPLVVDRGAFEEVFEVVRRLTLDENEQAMTVLPMVTTGEPGEFLIAEPREGQVNVYGVDGRLRRILGRRGEGPGEFTLPIMARRTLDGGAVVADTRLARLTFFPPDGKGEPNTVKSPIPLLLDAQDLGGGRYLLSGQSMSDDPPRLLHIWNRGTGEVERRFLPMGVPEESRPYATSYTAVDAVLEGDTIWAVWALSDTLYKFDRRGEHREKFPLSLPRPMGALPGAEAGAITDPGAIQEAADALTQVNGVFIMGSGRLAVQSMQTRGSDAVWDLVITDRRGTSIWSATDIPRLFAIEQDLFYFDDPASILPNHWVVARWRGEG